MPPRSQAQRRAMYAAASGQSMLGIPQGVGQEYAAADPGGKLPERKVSPKKSLQAMVKRSKSRGK